MQNVHWNHTSNTDSCQKLTKTTKIISFQHTPNQELFRAASLLPVISSAVSCCSLLDLLSDDTWLLPASLNRRHGANKKEPPNGGRCPSKLHSSAENKSPKYHTTSRTMNECWLVSRMWPWLRHGGIWLGRGSLKQSSNWETMRSSF